MYLRFENEMLARFRAMQEELASNDPSVHLYVLVDTGRMSIQERDFLCGDWDSEQWPLYVGSGLDHLEKTGPTLFAMPDLRGDNTYTSGSINQRVDPLTIFWRVLRLAERDAQLVSWIWTSCEMEPFIGHLQTLLYARLGPDDEDAWFFFYQPSYLRVLHRSLPDDTRRHMFGPCHAWWTLDAQSRLFELSGEGSEIPRIWDAFPIPAETVTELQRDVMPQQVLEWIDTAVPGLVASGRPNERLREIEPFVRRALEYGLSRKADVAVFVAHGLHYRHDYDRHAVLQRVLSEHLPTGPSLIDQYQSISSDVWREIEATKPERIESEKRAIWHNALKKEGRVATTLRFVNARGKDIPFIRFWFTDEVPVRYHNMADGIKWSSHTQSVLEYADIEVPVPGARMTVYWNEPDGWSEKLELTVTGELPLNKKSGMLEITLSKANTRAVMHSINPCHSSTASRQKVI